MAHEGDICAARCGTNWMPNRTMRATAIAHCVAARQARRCWPSPQCPLDKFKITSGEPSKRRSSSFGQRWFCRDCGTQLAMHVDHQPDTIDFTIPSLDDPNVITPTFHIFTGSRIGWFETADDLPRHERFRPNTRGP